MNEKSLKEMDVATWGHCLVCHIEPLEAVGLEALEALGASTGEYRVNDAYHHLHHSCMKPIASTTAKT